MKTNQFAKLLKMTVLSAGAYAGLSLAPNVASAAWFNCDITAVYEDQDMDQLFVQCSNTVSGHGWFAIRTADYDGYSENRFMQMASSALLSGRHFRVNHGTTDCTGSNWSAGQCYYVTAWSIYTLQ